MGLNCSSSKPMAASEPSSRSNRTSCEQKKMTVQAASRLTAESMNSELLPTLLCPESENLYWKHSEPSVKACLRKRDRIARFLDKKFGLKSDRESSSIDAATDVPANEVTCSHSIQFERHQEAKLIANGTAETAKLEDFMTDVSGDTGSDVAAERASADWVLTREVKDMEGLLTATTDVSMSTRSSSLDGTENMSTVEDVLSSVFQGILVGFGIDRTLATCDLMQTAEASTATLRNFEAAVTGFELKSSDSSRNALIELANALDVLRSLLTHLGFAEKEIARLVSAIEQMRDPKLAPAYLGDALLVKGRDIFHYVERAVDSFNNSDWEQFGSDVGNIAAEVVAPSMVVPQQQLSFAWPFSMCCAPCVIVQHEFLQ